jgi:hypothetical protein
MIIMALDHTRDLLHVSLAIIFLHNLSSLISTDTLTLPGKIAMMLVSPAALPFGKGGLVALYPVCRWYGKYKENHRDKKWLRYI